jgi:hypothetical protein
MATKTRKTRKATAPANETPEQRFKRLANPRVNAALKRIQLIGNLAGPGYGSTDEQREKIIDALTQAVSVINDKFKKNKPASQQFNID